MEESARRSLAGMLAAAVGAAHEYVQGQQMIAIEEQGAVERLGEALLPALTKDSVARVLKSLPDARVRAVVDAHAAQIAPISQERADASDDVIDDAEVTALNDRKRAVDARIAQARQRLHALRLRPSFAVDHERHRRGQPIGPDSAALVHEVSTLQGTIEALEAEGARVVALLTRNLRARRKVAALDDQRRAIDEGFLRDARTVVVDAAVNGAHAGSSTGSSAPELTAAARVLSGINAKRMVLDDIYAERVRPHGEALTALDAVRPGDPDQASLFAQRVEGAVAAAAPDLLVWQRTLPGLLSFASYAEVAGDDWWSVLAPGLRAPPAVVVDAAAAASDRLAAAWAEMSSSKPADAPAPVPLAGSSTPSMVLTLSLPPLPAPEPVATLVLPRASQSSAQIPDPFLFPDDLLPGQGSLPHDDVPKTDNPFLESTREIRRPLSALMRLAPSFAPGSRVGRCVIETLIGKGGMGEVYRARLEGEGGFRRTVVLKRLLMRGAGPEELKAFVREAEVAARIAHPNVVQIFDLQIAGEEPYMIMEFLDGMTLHHVATKGRASGRPMDPRILARCALDAARGLHAAHSMRDDDGTLVGLVHRDVSPDNLFLCLNGFTKLLDFGIARRSDATTQTNMTAIKGKVPYMSPEQVLGEPLDARSDLFSLGSSLYWLVTGQRPFVGDNDLSTLFAVVNKAHRPVRELVKSGNAGFVSLIDDLLKKPRDERPASALDVVQRLEACGPASPEEASAYLQSLWT
jgi:hypothetical protein